MNELSPNFLCKCGHRNKMHCIDIEDCFKNYNIKGRMCIEYRSYPNIFDPETNRIDERICMCRDFIPDNMAYLEGKYVSKM